MSAVAPPKPLLRDQLRARDAYRRVRDVDPAIQAEYRTLALDLGTSILRLGLAGALSRLEGSKSRAARTLLDDLASFAALGVEPGPSKRQLAGADLPNHIRDLSADNYMLATRELLRVATWLRRAVQAMTARGSEEDGHAK